MTARRGLALLIVVGVLGILAVLAAAFVTMAQLERRASRQRLNATKAELLARSGIEDALARLSADQDPTAASDCYRGEDWDGDGDLSSREADSEVYKPTGAGTAADVDGCPVRHALRPSFPAKTGGNPTLLPVAGRERGYTGRLSGDQVPTGNSYALKVASGGIHVNGGNPAAAPTDGYNAVLKRILGTLAEALNREEGAPVSLADGENLVARRPGVGWRSFREIRDVALGGDQAKLDALQPCLTLHAWVDRKVIRPNADGLEDKAFQCWADIKLGRWYDGGNYGASSREAPVLEPRAPVDLGWARSRRPVLIALLAGLKGLRLDETTAESATGGNLVGTLRSAELVLDWGQPTDDCRLAADAIRQSTRALKTWQDWDAFCDALAFPGTPYQAQAKRDILKAHFNPNSDLNKFNPNRSLARLVDKSDLLAYSTEFSLVPTGGGRMTSVGRLTDRSGTLLAERELSAEIAPYQAVRLTTQGEFVAGDLGRLDEAGDESAFRAYGTSPFISPSQGTGKTFAHKLLPSCPQGISLQTAPEPPTVWTLPGTGKPAAYDGQVHLATVETGDTEYFTSPSLLTFLARWNINANADVGGNKANVGDAAQPTPRASLWDAIYPGTLYPDGLYVEKDRTPGYNASNNMAPSRGTISFWLKPNYDLAQINAYPGNDKRKHLFFNNTLKGPPPEGGPPNSGSTACFIILDQYEDGSNAPRAFSFHWESVIGWENKREQVRKTPERLILPHRWYQATFFWDMLPPVQPAGDGQLSSHILVDAGDPGSVDYPEDRNTSDLYYFGSTIESDPPPDNFTIQHDGTGNPQVFYLGRRGRSPDIIKGSHLPTYGEPDVTFDEFAIYYFGANNGDNAPITSAEDMALNRFNAGRYYKESAYVGLFASPGMNKAGRWYSAPIALGDARIRGLSWTQVVPPALRATPPVPDDGKPENWDPGPEGRIVLDLVDGRDPEGDAWVLDASGRAVDTLFTDPAWSRVARRLDAPFRLHAVFQPNLADPGNTAILDPLALDDVTVVYEPMAGRRILSWAGEE